MESLNNFDIRYSEMDDLPFLKGWLLHADVLQWTSMSNEKEVENGAGCWIQYSKYKASLTAIVDGLPCGIATLFLMPYKKVSHHCMVKVIVDAAYQRRGIGTSLIRNIKHLAKNYFRMEILHVEIMEGNPIAKILESEGFSVFARQENYFLVKGHWIPRILYEVDLL